MKESVSSFLSNVLSVILGIVITFTVQGIINRTNEKREVRSALDLVRSELVTNAEDIAIMTFDNDPFSELAQPQLTAIDADMFDMGQEAARFILRKIRMPELHTQRYCTIPRIIERQST